MAAHRLSLPWQVGRLLRWSEAQLCDLISVETVCGLLALAHLYEVRGTQHVVQTV